MLTNGGKTSFFYYHWWFLPTDHKYKKFFIGRVERDALLLPQGEKLFEAVSEYDDIVFGFKFDKQKFSSFGLTHNWVKQSIFQKFPY